MSVSDSPFDATDHLHERATSCYYRIGGLVTRGQRDLAVEIIEAEMRSAQHEVLLEAAKLALSGEPTDVRTDQVDSADSPLARRNIHARCRIDDHSPLLDGSPQMREIRALIERIAGKNLVARAIHAASRGRDDPFIKNNCAAIPSELLESEARVGRVQHLIRSPLPSWLSKKGLSTARQPDESDIAPARGRRP